MPFATLPRRLLVAALVAPLAGCASLPGSTGTTSIPKDQPATIAGELTTRSPVNVNDGSRYQSFPLQLEGGQVVEVRLQQSDFGSQLSLLDDQQRLVNGPGNGALTLVPPRSGRYQLNLSGDSATRYGPFNLKLSRIDVRNSGALASGDRFAGLLDSSSGNNYQLQVSEPAIYRITLASDMLDTVLRLNGEGLSLENDDSDDSTNSRIDTYLEPGTYTVVAAALEEAPKGTYVLAAEQRPLPAGVKLSTGGLLQADKSITGIGGSAPLTYQLRVDRPALVTVRMSSGELDAHLALSGNGVDASDDDGAGNGTDAQITHLLEPGEYNVVATAVDNRSGLFTLVYSQQPLSRGSLGELHAGQYATGALRSTESHASLRISRAGDYQIDLASSDFDALLYLQGNDVDLEDDDSGGNRNARLTTHLEPGMYNIRVRGVDQPSRGRFRLSVVEQQ